jgi:hypothetical protein
MNDINAAIGIENLKIVGDNIRRHINNAGFYDWWINDESGLITLLILMRVGVLDLFYIRFKIETISSGR